MVPEQSDERGAIRAVEEHLTAVYGVVVDDVVMRAWGNGQIELSQLLLSAAITSSGAAVDETDLWAVARIVAFPPSGAEDDVPLAERLAALAATRRPA